MNIIALYTRNVIWLCAQSGEETGLMCTLLFFGRGNMYVNRLMYYTYFVILFIYSAIYLSFSFLFISLLFDCVTILT